MLPDPLTVKAPVLNGTTALTLDTTESFAIIDVSPGRTVRQANLSALASTLSLLTISHSVSNENRPSKTDRHLIRLDTRFKAGIEDSREVTASAYCVVAVPRGAYTETNGDPVDNNVVQHLLNILFGAMFTGSSNATLDSGAKFFRLLGGEP